MKLFQKLLLAPAALGLMAPLAVDANRSASAADLNIAGLRQYGPVALGTSQEQVASITQFSDVQPTDWAYQALSNLIERYGCIAGYPNGTYRGNRAMTRYEAAAMLNACLDRITEVTDELKRLMKQFEKELAVLKGHVDGLEAKVGELEATQFSTTTKLRGQATFVLGATKFTGTQWPNPYNKQVPGSAPSNKYYNPNNSSTNKDAKNRFYGATTFNYDVRLSLDTSFTGRDLLRTTLRADNFFSSDSRPNLYSSALTLLEVAQNAPRVANQVEVNRLFYNFPAGKNIRVTIGGLVRIDDPGMLGMWPSAYPADSVLNYFSLAGAPGAYNTNGLGAGAGITYTNAFGTKGWSLSTNYVATNGWFGNPNVDIDGGGGIGTRAARSVSVTQLGYAGDKALLIGGSAWGFAAAYTYSQGVQLGSGTTLIQTLAYGNNANNVGISGYWVPEASGWIPSISTGWGISTINPDMRITDGSYSYNQYPQANSWYVGLQWSDAFAKGNALGMAVGQAPFLTRNRGGSYRERFAISGNLDSNYMWEWWYKFHLTDNITITPSLYYINDYFGQLGRVNESNGTYSNSLNAIGGLIKTTFKF